MTNEAFKKLEIRAAEVVALTIFVGIMVYLLFIRN